MVDILFSNDIIKLIKFIKFTRTNYMNIYIYIYIKKYLYFFDIFYTKIKFK